MADRNDATIFYSWQSDDSKTRSYIEECLKSVIADIASDPNLDFAPRMDKDTQGTTGAVEIAKTILAKIDNCQVFMADVTVIGTSGKRSLVNQNVLFELGYAIARHGNENTILVANEDTTDVDKLPFDIKGWRVAKFSMTKDPKGALFKKELKQIIESHLAVVETVKSLESSLTLQQELIAAIEESKPTRTKAEMYFSDLYQKLIAAAPPRFRGDISGIEYGKLTYEKYDATKPIIAEFAKIVSIASEYQDERTLVAAYKKLEILTQYYDVVPSDNGQLNHISIEYYSLVTYELISVLVGYITRDELWDTLKKINDTKLNRPPGYQDDRSIESLYKWPEATLAYYKKLKQQDFSIPISPLLEERWTEEPDILKAYVDGSIFLYLMLEEYYPWSIGIVTNSSTWRQYKPEYIKQFLGKNFLHMFLGLTADVNISDLKESLFTRITKKIGNFSYSYSSLGHLFKDDNITSKDDLGSS